MRDPAPDLALPRITRHVRGPARAPILNLRALVLWDIDGTLVDSAPFGRDAFVEAFERIVGRPPDEIVPFAGRTDLEIAADLLERSGVA